MPRQIERTGVSKKDAAAAAGASAQETPDEQIGKGRPTPSRKQAEAANARPIVGSKDKTMQKEQRRQQADARERARLGMMQGDERYLTVRDRGPQRRFVRDYVDARWNIGEMLIPMMLVVLVMTFIPGVVQVISLVAIWAFVALAILDSVFVGMKLKRLLANKFGADKVQPGYRWYAAMRAMQFRPLRVPKPQVKRGNYPS
ncbi:DUF3043 domain-containing protein [Leucobacter chromiireducens subsp. chromiireducens]|uniref:DUF3043 domain-containing protein n=1 Tax=Leucobacter chromiireducens subsp. chromiireducens TaxID=660067 RepID=A0ABS1SR79_9MICO|nr:DUF3043 domain-containing protein [Leucobacter chromiireducens]MBL3690658.1 DUF3043 domain-containing protein [Leucobacter chromiireducens subsp. chromiireducens]